MLDKRLGRRDVLKAAIGTVGAGALVGVADLESALAAEGPLAPLAAGSGTAPGGASPAGAGAAAPPVTAGLQYVYYRGADFIPRMSITTWSTAGTGADRYLTANSDFVPCRVDLPQGSVIKEVKFDIIKNGAPNPTFTFSRFDGTNNTLSDVHFVSPTVTDSASVQTVSPFATLGDVIDNTQFSYVLYWNPNATDTSHRLIGARIGYVNGITGITPIAPARILDTRSLSGPTAGAPLSPNTVYTFGPFTGANGITAQAVGVVANFTVGAGSGNFSGAGFAAVFPATGATGSNTWPGTSNINMPNGAPAIANGVSVPFGTGSFAGKLSFYVGGGAPATHVVLDASGFLS